MNDKPLSPSIDLSETELQQLRQALTLKYPDARDVLGAQLGYFIHDQLNNADLKARFGGLKNFVTRYFPAEISWRGKKGLDDLYDARFASSGASDRTEVWQSVKSEASPWLWSSVTNPSTAVQFAWSSERHSLMRAVAGVQPTEGLTAVEKLSNGDYQSIARNFVASLEAKDFSRYLRAIESSAFTVEFTTMMREEGLLSKWEEFRVDHAVRLFADRLLASGVDGETVAQWAELLRASQREARSQRGHKTTVESIVQRPRQPNRNCFPSGTLETRAVALKTLEFLSESELSELRLPLGSVMHALRSLSIG
jgi:hypothetical protein